MTEVVGEALIELRATDRRMAGDVDSAGKTAGKRFSGSFGTAVKGLGALVGGAAVFGLLKGANAEAREAQKTGALTESIIKSTGGAANVTAKEVGALAESLSKKVGMDDELIQSGANMLLTFKNVRNEAGKNADVFDRATAAAADLSAAGFGDVAGQAKALGKALNDPIKGMSALGRSGVTFTKEQQEQVKALVESGDTLKAQQIILKEVESQVGGAAEATATAGDHAGVALGNLKETIGTAMLPLVDKLATGFTEDVAPAIEGFITGMEDGTGAGGLLVDAVESLWDGLSTLVEIGGDVAGFLREHATATGIAAGAMAALFAITKLHSAYLAVQAVGGLVAYIAQMGVVQSATKVWAAVQWVLNAALTANPIGIVIAVLVALGIALVIAYKKSETFRNVVTAVVDGIAAAWRWLWNNVLQPVFKLLVKGIAWIMDKFGDMLEAMSHVPGFGWAKDAADKMHGAADKARELADSIKKIPPKKDIFITYHETTIRSIINKQANDRRLTGANARGTSNWRGGLTWVGEQGRELVELPRGTRIYSNPESESMVSKQGASIQIVNNYPKPEEPSTTASRLTNVAYLLGL